VERPTERKSRGALGEIMLILGGALMGISSVLAHLDWRLDEVLTGGGVQSGSFKGIDTDDGKFFLAFGVVLLLAGTALWIIRSQSWRVVVCGASLAIAGFMIYVGVANITGISDDALEGLLGTDDPAVMEEARPHADFDAGVGLYVATGGAALALLGALFSFRPRFTRETSHLPAGWTPPGEQAEQHVEPRAEQESDLAWSPPATPDPASETTRETSQEPWRRMPE
jgi:hypothetical protein